MSLWPQIFFLEIIVCAFVDAIFCARVLKKEEKKEEKKAEKKKNTQIIAEIGKFKIQAFTILKIVFSVRK